MTARVVPDFSTACIGGGKHHWYLIAIMAPRWCARCGVLLTSFKGHPNHLVPGEHQIESLKKTGIKLVTQEYRANEFQRRSAAAKKGAKRKGKR